jgi:transposase
MAHGRYDLTDFEWKTIQPLLPDKPRGVPRVDDRKVLNGIFFILRSGMPWADLPERYGPYTTIYNRFRWRKAGVWDRLMDAIIAAHEAFTSRLPPKKTMWRLLYRSFARRTDQQDTSQW